MSRISYTYTIIGDGRVARHFSYYLSTLDLPFHRWARRGSTQEDLLEKVDRSTHVIVLISDAAIEGFIRKNPALSEKTVVHFSGSLVTPLAHGAHPLMTFTERLYRKDQYPRIPFILDKGQTEFRDLLPGFSNPHFFIDPELRPLYHAFCVSSGNFTTILWERFFTGLTDKLGLPAEVAEPYLQQICENLLTREVNPLTGPLARKDFNTIRANLQALEGDPLQRVYYGFLSALDLTMRENS